MPRLENLQQRLEFLPAFRAERKVVLDAFHDLLHGFGCELAFGELTDMLKALAAIEFAVAGETEHGHHAAYLFAAENLIFGIHELNAF